MPAELADKEPDNPGCCAAERYQRALDTTVFGNESVLIMSAHPATTDTERDDKRVAGKKREQKNRGEKKGESERNVSYDYAVKVAGDKLTCASELTMTSPGDEVWSPTTRRASRLHSPMMSLACCT